MSKVKSMTPEQAALFWAKDSDHAQQLLTLSATHSEKMADRDADFKSEQDKIKRSLQKEYEKAQAAKLNGGAIGLDRAEKNAPSGSIAPSGRGSRADLVKDDGNKSFVISAKASNSSLEKKSHTIGNKSSKGGGGVHFSDVMTKDKLLKPTSRFIAEALSPAKVQIGGKSKKGKNKRAKAKARKCKGGV